jgi:hypothetical protein
MTGRITSSAGGVLTRSLEITGRITSSAAQPLTSSTDKAVMTWFEEAAEET